MQVKSKPSVVAETSLKAMQERLLHLLTEKSFQMSDTPEFPLASGTLSQYYIDCKKAFSYPEARESIGRLIAARCKGSNFTAVGGLVIGAYPVAIAVSDALYRSEGREIRVFIVRKEPKKHGLRKRIDGDVEKGESVLVVDDVITSGGSTIEAIRQCREAGLTVVRAIAIIDREEQDGRRHIEAEGVEFEALYTLSDLKEHYESLHGR